MEKYDNNPHTSSGSDEKLKSNGNKNLKGTEEGYNSSSPDKYLEIEQPGVSYTGEPDPLHLNPDEIEDRTIGNTGVWDANEKNSRNAEAFNQDENLLNDNIDLDEDQSTSISSDDR